MAFQLAKDLKTAMNNSSASFLLNNKKIKEILLSIENEDITEFYCPTPSIDHSSWCVAVNGSTLEFFQDRTLIYIENGNTLSTSSNVRVIHGRKAKKIRKALNVMGYSLATCPMPNSDNKHDMMYYYITYDPTYKISYGSSYEKYIETLVEKILSDKLHSNSEDVKLD